MAPAARPAPFRRAFVSTLSLDVVARGLSALAVVIFLRELGVADFAYVVLFLAVGQVAGAAATSGLGIHHARREAERVSRGQRSDPASFATALVGGLALIVVLGAIAVTTAVVPGAAGPRGEAAAFVLLAAAFAAGHATAQLVMFHHQAHKSFTTAGLVGVARGGALLAVAGLTTAGILTSKVEVAGGLAAGMVAIGAWSAWPTIAAAGRLRDHLSRRLGLGPEASWLTVYYLAWAPYAYAAIFIVSATLDDTALASFGAAQRYYAIVIGAAPALLAVLRVRTSQPDIVDSVEAQRALLVNWIKRTALPVAAALGAIAALAPVVIPVIDGDRYPLSITVLQLMLIPAFALYVGNPARSLLMAQHRYAVLALTMTAGLAAIVIAGLLAAVLAGATAVAIAIAAVNTTVLVALVLLAFRRTERPGERPEGLGLPRAERA